MAGCRDALAPDLDALAAARARWAAANLSQYEFDYVEHCGECPAGHGVIYHVRVFASGTVVMTAADGTPAPAHVQRPTVPLLFDRIATVLRASPDRLELRYHGTLGYPELISVDPDGRVLDDEWGVTVSNLAAF